MNELMTIKTTELANKELGKNLSYMVKAMLSEHKSGWMYADALENIISGKQWEDDFDSQKDFAESIGISAGRISQCVGAVKFITGRKIEEGDVTVENAYLLSAIKKNDEDFETGKTIKVSGTDDFLNYMYNDNGMTDSEIFRLSSKKLKEYIKVWKSIITVDDSAIDEESANVTEEVMNQPEETKVVEFELDGKLYRVPEDILARYIVKE